MLTVFTVLGLVVLLGRMLIYMVNTFFAEPPATQSTIDQATPAVTTGETLAVIAAAVEVATAGKGRVTTIELLPQDDDLSL